MRKCVEKVFERVCEKVWPFWLKPFSLKAAIAHAPSADCFLLLCQCFVGVFSWCTVRNAEGIGRRHLCSMDGFRL